MMHWVWHVALIERGLVAAVSVSPTICDHPHFADEGLKAPNMWPVPSLLPIPIPEIRSEVFWSIMRERESLSVLAAGMSH